jgi:hypothetical protein
MNSGKKIIGEPFLSTKKGGSLPSGKQSQDERHHLLFARIRSRGGWSRA